LSLAGPLSRVGAMRWRRIRGTGGNTGGKRAGNILGGGAGGLHGAGAARGSEKLPCLEESV
jgi:hypothetical protein